MPKRIYVGNLPFAATDDEVRNLFKPYGKVRSLKMERGQATVELESDAAAEKAIRGLGAARLGGNRLKIS